MIFAFATLVIFMSAGLAVEYSQSINIKTRVNNALDAATLATARAIQIGEITEEQGEAYLKDVFIANVGIEALEGSLYEIKNVVINPVTQEVSAQATYDQDLDFISIGATSGFDGTGQRLGRDLRCFRCRGRLRARHDGFHGRLQDRRAA